MFNIVKAFNKAKLTMRSPVFRVQFLFYQIK